MKDLRSLLILALTILSGTTVRAQSGAQWNGLNYQAVVRGVSGDPLPNQTVNVYTELWNGVDETFISYGETHLVTTNAHGLIDLLVGQGTPDPVNSIGFDEIDWDRDTPWNVHVEMDLTGGTNFSFVSASQLRAVPYAQHASSADTLTSGVHWELVGNEVQNTGGGPVRVMENMWVQGGVFLNNAVNFPGWDISGQTGSLTFNELFQGPRLTLEPGGNVGIGTDNPTSELHVIGTKLIMENTGQTNGTAYMDLKSGTAGGSTMTIGVVGGSGDGIVYQRSNQPLLFGTNDQLRMKISEAGNVGIGTNNPTSELHVIGTKLIMENTGQTNGTAYMDLKSGTAGGSTMTIGVAGGSGDGIVYQRSNQPLLFGTNDQLRMLISEDGNVGIGTTTPQSKLAVNGKITCKEVEVTLAGFPDYVFDADYDLMTLEEVEAYIKANGHLPKVPSACEVEENGIGLGELNKILLEKVEELTLHLIDKEAELKQLRADVDALLGR